MAPILSTRVAYGRVLVALGERSSEVVVLDADLSGSTQTKLFAERFPERFFNMGISEQDLMGTAAGMALAGKTVFVSSFAIFVAGRCWEQIRNSVALPGCAVNIVATHGGLTVGPDGASHQALEDIGIMRAIPTMTVIVPCDAVETHKAVEAAAWYDGPTYVRLTREDLPVVDSKERAFTIGRGWCLREGRDVTLCGVGMMLHVALEAAEALQEEGIDAEVINMPTIKPIDERLIRESAERTGCMVSVEEHNICGGLGDAIGEVLLRLCPIPMERVAVRDSFGRSGSPSALLHFFDLTPESVVKAARRAVKRKRRGN